MFDQEACDRERQQTRVKKPGHRKAQKHFPIYSMLPEDNTHTWSMKTEVSNKTTYGTVNSVKSLCVRDNEAKSRGEKTVGRGRDGMIFHFFLLNKVLCWGFQGKEAE